MASTTMGDHTRASSLKLRRRSEDMRAGNDAASSRRPSVPSLQIPFAPAAPISAAARFKARRKSRPSIHTSVTNGFAAHLTPPETPNSPSGEMDVPFFQQSLFHNYLRAMHSFDPSSETMPDDDASQSATAIRPGDLILVHCIHANGWADGTVLNTGIRGWLPTNYCEAYDHPYLRNLLNAMTQFWDLLGASEDASLSTFVRQDYIRGLIAGVRYLLERVDCLHRDASCVKQHAGVRRMRKGVLADLSSLVQIAKRLQDTIGEAFAGEVIHVLLDDLISRAFKVVTRAVSFTDVWTQETSAGKNNLDLASPISGPSPLPVDNGFLAVDTKGLAQPGTTPIDSAKHFPDSTESLDTAATDVDPTGGEDYHQDDRTEQHPRRSVVFTPPNGFAAHRVSMLTNESPVVTSGPLASEQLAKVHDVCISHIGAFIGHHLHSRPSAELVATTERLVNACRSMLAIIEEVYSQDLQNSGSLQQAKHEFEVKVDELAKSTQDVFRFSDSPDEDVIMMPDQTTHLISVGTSLIRNTGECVMKTRQLIEHMGDFELRTAGLSLSRSGVETPTREDSTTPQSKPREERNTQQKRTSLGHRLSRTLALPPPPIPREDPGAEDGAAAVDYPNEGGVDDDSSSNAAAAITAVPRKPLPPIPQAHRRSMGRASQASSNIMRESLKSPKSTRSESISPARKDSVGMSIAGSTDTWNSSTRDSSQTAVSQISTRATTPEQVKDFAVSEPGLTSSFASISSIPSQVTEDSIDGEALLQKTYANELTFNNNGQVTGGSIPALVEQLTTHDSAPDPQFVTAFFLTFRKFCEPREFAQALIYRFDYIGDSRTVGTPARLRIYNVFKGWLETYWNADADKEALGEIRFFALHKLKQVLPAAGERLIELTRRVTEAYANGTISSPLVSGVGKISMSIGHRSAAAQDVPESAITAKQLNMLRVATGGGSPCTIFDFDATEIARQITLVVMKAYCEVRPNELLSMDWGKANTKKAKNVRNMCLLNTDLSHVVGETILAPDDAKKRAKTIGHWAKIGLACVELSNYDSVMAIMCSINSSVVQRLKRTWEIVNKKTKARLEELEQVVDMSKNYSSLRRRLESPTAPCLPFLGVYLTDLTFVIAGNAKRRELPGMTTETGDPVSVINFDMYMRIAKIVSHLQKFQVPYKLHHIPELQTWLEQHLKRMRASHEDMVTTLHRRSLAIEPKQDEGRKQHSALGAFYRTESDDRSRASLVRTEASPIDRFDFFHKSTSLLNLRSHSTRPPSRASDEPKPVSAQ